MSQPGSPANANFNRGAPLLTDWVALQAVNGSGWKVASLADILALFGGGSGPVGVMVTAFETIVAGAFLNYFDSAGTGLARNAIASNPAAFANGFAPEAIAMGATGLMSLGGLNAAAAVAVPASAVWLSDTTPGGFMTTRPVTGGHIIQPLGPAFFGLGVGFTFVPPELV